MTRRASILAAAWLLLAASAAAQAPDPAASSETKLGAEFRHEGDHLKEKCALAFSALLGCAVEGVTDNPVHLAIGSLAPQNGFALGPAFVTHDTPSENWNYGINGDAVRSANGSWRAGAYLTLVHTPVELPVPILDPGSGSSSPDVTIHPYTVIDAYVQAESLRTVLFFGLGPDSSATSRTAFGMNETIVGGRALVPLTVAGRLNLSLLGELDGRFVALGDPNDPDDAPVSSLFSDTTAPGLSTQPAYAQAGGGVRIKPSIVNDHLRLDYLARYDQFAAVSDSTLSFHRWTIDLNHDIPITHTVTPGGTKDSNGPDDCSSDAGAAGCPAVSRNRYGSVGLRVYGSASIASAGHAVPFYLQPTLGGSDIDGAASLIGFGDYRFRGPAAFLLQQSVERSIYGVVGGTVLVEEGAVGLSRRSINLRALETSVAAGLTLRAGGVPMAQLLWAHSREGHRFVATVSTSLLGGSGRPSLH